MLVHHLAVVHQVWWRLVRPCPLMLGGWVRTWDGTVSWKFCKFVGSDTSSLLNESQEIGFPQLHILVEFPRIEKGDFFTKFPSAGDPKNNDKDMSMLQSLRRSLGRYDVGCTASAGLQVLVSNLPVMVYQCCLDRNHFHIPDDFCISSRNSNLRIRYMDGMSIPVSVWLFKKLDYIYIYILCIYVLVRRPYLTYHFSHRLAESVMNDFPNLGETTWKWEVHWDYVLWYWHLFCADPRHEKTAVPNP